MSQITRMLVSGLLLLTGLFLLAGCGSSSNSPAAMDPASPSGHPANWLPAGHAAVAQADFAICSQCHGMDLLGGISRVSCTQCHLGNFQTVHPVDWDDLVGIRHAGYVRSNGNAACSNINCHGATLTGVSGSGPSCTSCHLGGLNSVHPQDWGSLASQKHPAYVAANGTTACANIVCHGPALTGVPDSGPSCTSCHLGGLTSVHPQDWGALTYVKHAAYVGANGSKACSNIVCHGQNLAGVSGSGPSCTSCHLGGVNSVHPADWTTGLEHAAYVGAHGTSSCSNVVCHGAQLQGVSFSGPSCNTCHKFP